MSDIRWLVMLCGSRLFFGFIFMAFSSAAPLLLVDWNLTASQVGMINAGWHLGYMASLVTAGLLSNQWGAKKTFLRMSWAACLSAWLFAFFANNFSSALALYSLAGLCSGGSYTTGLTLISERIEPKNRGVAMGWFLAASSLGYALFLFTGGALISAAGWRASFWLAALGPMVGLVIAVKVLSVSENIVRIHPTSRRLEALKSVMRNKPAMLAIWAYTFHSWELLALWAWLPAYFAAAAANQNSIATAAGIGSALAGLTFLTNAIGSIAGGHMSNTFGRRRVMLLMTGTSIGFSFLFGWLFTMPLWLLTLVAISYNMAALGDSSVYSSALSELVPAEDLSIAYALRATLGFGLGALSPLALGFALDLASLETGTRGTVAWGLAWSVLGLGALPGLWAISRMQNGLRLTHSSHPL